MIPPLHAALGAKPAEYPTNGVEDGSGPLATFKVFVEGEWIIGEYKVGFASEKRTIFSEGRTVLGAVKATPDGAASGSKQAPSGTNRTPSAARSPR